MIEMETRGIAAGLIYGAMTLEMNVPRVDRALRSDRTRRLFPNDIIRNISLTVEINVNR